MNAISYRPRRRTSNKRINTNTLTYSDKTSINLALMLIIEEAEEDTNNKNNKIVIIVTFQCPYVKVLQQGRRLGALQRPSSAALGSVA